MSDALAFDELAGKDVELDVVLEAAPVVLRRATAKTEAVVGQAVGIDADPVFEVVTVAETAERVRYREDDSLAAPADEAV